MFSIETEAVGDSKRLQQCVTSMKDLTHLLDQLLRISHVFNLNSKTISCMMEAADRYEDAKHRDDFNLSARAVQREYEFLGQSAETLLARGNNLSRQVRRLICTFPDPTADDG